MYVIIPIISYCKKKTTMQNSKFSKNQMNQMNQMDLFITKICINYHMHSFPECLFLLDIRSNFTHSTHFFSLRIYFPFRNQQSASNSIIFYNCHQIFFTFSNPQNTWPRRIVHEKVVFPHYIYISTTIYCLFLCLKFISCFD